MCNKLICVVLFVTLSASVAAQNGQLSLGLSTTYMPSGIVGLGGTLDYRRRICTGFEAIGQLTALRFWWVEQLRSDRRGGSVAGTMDLYFSGIGLGYRDSTEFHIGLLGGGMHYMEAVRNGPNETHFLPGLALTLGTGFGRRMDISLDTWFLTSLEGDLSAVPILRFSYGLCSRK